MTGLIVKNGKLNECLSVALVTCMKHQRTTDQTIEIQVELERQLVRLEQSMKVTDEALQTVELDQAAVGRLSRMDSLQNQSLSKGLREREVVRLSQLRDAIGRIEKRGVRDVYRMWRRDPLRKALSFSGSPRMR